LLVEYEQSTKSNVFKDKRIGEMDPSLSKEDKALLRYQVHQLVLSFFFSQFLFSPLCCWKKEKNVEKAIYL
jgi:hypothetical protein